MKANDLLPKEFQANLFEILDEYPDYYSVPREKRDLYDLALKRYRDTLCTIDGMKEMGQEEGIRIGEKLAEVRAARVLKSLGISYETIQAATGLSAEDIERL